VESAVRCLPLAVWPDIRSSPSLTGPYDPKPVAGGPASENSTRLHHTQSTGIDVKSGHRKGKKNKVATDSDPHRSILTFTCTGHSVGGCDGRELTRILTMAARHRGPAGREWPVLTPWRFGELPRTRGSSVGRGSRTRVVSVADRRALGQSRQVCPSVASRLFLPYSDGSVARGTRDPRLLFRRRLERQPAAANSSNHRPPYLNRQRCLFASWQEPCHHALTARPTAR